MNLKRITATGLNGQTFAQDVGKINLLLGESGSGKTSRIRALEIATGHGFMTKPQIMSMANGSGFSCGVEFDGLSITRNVNPHKTPAETVRIPGMGEGTISEMQAEIDKQLGSFHPSFSIGQFIGMNDRKKLEYLFGITSVSDGSERETILNAFTECMKIRDGYEDCVSQAVRAWPEGVGVIDGVNALINEIKDVAKQCRKTEKDGRGFLRSSAEIDAKRDMIGKSIGLLKSEITAINDVIGRLNTTIGQAQAAAKTQNDARAKTAQIDARISALRAKMPDVDIAGMFDVSAAEITELRKTIDGFSRNIAQIETQIDIEKQLATRFKNANGICPACLQPWVITDEAKNELKAKYLNLSASLKSAQQSRTDVNSKLNRTLEIQTAQNISRQIADLESSKPTQPTATPADIIDVADDLDKNKRLLDVKQAQLESKIAENNALDREIEISKKTAQAKGILDGLKESEVIIRNLQGHILNDSLSRIIAPANEVLANVPNAGELHIEIVNDDCQFGWLKDCSTFVPFEQLSGGEKIIASLAFIAGQSACVTQPFRSLILDEVNLLSPMFLNGLVSAVNAASKHFDFVMLALNQKLPAVAAKNIEVSGWNVITLPEVAK